MTDWLGEGSESWKALKEAEHAPHRVAFKRISVEKCPAKIPLKWIEQQEQNQQIASCCRHPENHDIVALYSSQHDQDLGMPDIYVLICKEQHDFGDGIIGEAHHRKFCVGGGARPGWDVR